MSPRLIAQVIAGGRVAIGLALLVSPPLVTRGWVGSEESEQPGARALGMGLGARDLVLGAGVLAALNAGGKGAKPWLLGSLVADAMDLVGTLRNARELPNAGVAATGLIAGGATAAGAYVLASGDL